MTMNYKTIQNLHIMINNQNYGCSHIQECLNFALTPNLTTLYTHTSYYRCVQSQSWAKNQLSCLFPQFYIVSPSQYQYATSNR